jgi:hypothetical protein
METRLPSSSSRARNSARVSILLAALACAILVFWLGLKSAGGDWYISETRADILYTGVRSFHEFPYFSFAINGGSYLLQDPEGPLLSPTAPAVLLLGPSLGLRLMPGVWAGLGVLGFAQWLTGRVRVEAGLLAGVAAATSLGVLWKVAVGNDMFLWALGLPGFLFALRCVIERGTVLAAVVLGLWIGVFLLGPTFFVGTYLFLPVIPLAVLFEFGSARVHARPISKTLPLLMFACVLGCVIASPKLAMWLTLPMQRPTEDHGVLSLAQGLRGLWDYAVTKSSGLSVTSYDAGKAVIGGWDISEGTMALSPVATLLAGVGVVWGLRKGPQRQLALLALALVALGLTLSCSWPVWHAIRGLTHDDIRVAPRFVAVAAFGACILVAIGADAALDRFHGAARWLTVALVGSMLASGVTWVCSASHNYGVTRNDAVHPEAMKLFDVFWNEESSGSKIQSFTRVVPMHNTTRNILAGAAVVDSYRIVGNPAEPVDWWHGRPRSLSIAAHPADTKRTTVTHLSVQSRDLAAGARLRLRLGLPSRGFRIETSPPGVTTTADLVGDYLVLTNASQHPIQSLTFKATLPISPLWFVLAGGTLLASLVFVTVCLVHRQRAGSPASP